MEILFKIKFALQDIRVHPNEYTLSEYRTVRYMYSFNLDYNYRYTVIVIS